MGVSFQKGDQGIGFVLEYSKTLDVLKGRLHPLLGVWADFGHSNELLKVSHVYP